MDGGRVRPTGWVTGALVAALLPSAAAGAGWGDTDGEVRVSGRLETVVVDDFRGGRTEETTFLVLRDGTRLEIRRSPHMPRAGRVSATIDAPLDLDQRVRLLDATFTEGQTAVDGVPHRLHVAVVRNRGDWGAVTEATLRSRVQSVLDGWTLEAATALPAMDVAAWKDFHPDSGCGLGSSFSPVVQEAAAELFPGVDFTLQPNHLVVLVPDECEDQGAGAVGTASVGTSLGSGGTSVSSLEQDYGPSTLAHELGHNFGLDHSAGERCDTLEGECWLDEYGDLYDVMGGATRGTVPSLNSPHRDDLGLLEPGEVQDLELPLTQQTASRTMTLRPRSDGTGLRTLRIVEPETLDPWYVDYRSGTGRDANAGYQDFPDHPPGVLVLSGAGAASRLWSEAGPGPQSLAAGATYTNPAGTVSVRVDAIAPGVEATVTVTVRSDAPPLPAPATAVVLGTPRVDTYLSLDRTGWPPEARLQLDWWADGEFYRRDDSRLWVAPDLHGRSIQLVVRASLPGHRGVVRRSASIGPVTNPVTGTVTIGADPLRVGSPVASSVSTLPVDAVRAHQWHADNIPIPGAVGSTYVPTAADVGKALTLVVTASRSGRDTSALVSNSLGPVPAAASTLQPGSPSISGDAAVGNRLTAHPGSWPAGTSLSFRWLREGEPIPGAGGTTYALVAADRGRRVSVRVRGELDGVAPANVVSPAVVVAAGTLTTRRPTIVGKPRVGEKLVARAGAWTPGTRWTYRWFADDKRIRGATGRKLTLGTSQRGQRVSVRVTGRLAGYTSMTKASRPTRKVRR